jgi:alkylated DNA repair dioxygenase AlkB
MTTLQLVRSTEILEVLSRLSPQQRSATDLHFLQDLSYDEVAIRMNLPYWHVKRLIAESLDAARELWGVRLRRTIQIAPGFEVRYFPHFLNEQEADSWFERLQIGVPFRPEVITLCGKRFLLKRQTAQYGNHYAYNPTGQDPHPWSPLLADLRTLVEQITGFQFDSALCNLYPDGDAYIGWHSDSGHPKMIASLSVGARREIRFAAFGSTRAVHRMKLPHGSLLLIPQSVNDHFKHMVPRSKKISRPRINVTFRNLRINQAERVVCVRPSAVR